MILKRVRSPFCGCGQNKERGERDQSGHREVARATSAWTATRGAVLDDEKRVIGSIALPAGRANGPVHQNRRGP